ncbi:HAD family hydrolase [Cryobacterium sp. PAMC25264]|uniref:HAD family hydrolase n=1 Tax=Cryobacterium sp. PAMC25264 TaxID=2861288 RepID=UPI001C63704E|nr:HAD family hydrolase [Cryobacterium sp. PAMC25264]QYF72381.1 HAD family hydrolase [Cryobacterium sp. PAMC25264]
MSPAKAVLFDIDGTLVDSNYLHIDAWQRAFQTLDTDVEAWRIHRSIGQDAGQLLSSLVGERPDDWVSRAKELHAANYQELAPRLRVFPQARELLSALAKRGVIVVLAASAPEEELNILLDLLDSDEAIHATTNSDDVAVAKPDPDIVKLALERAGVEPAEALFIGDSVWDIEAAARARVRSLGVLSGGIAGDLLTDAGAWSVFGGTDEILDRLEELGLSA